MIILTTVGKRSFTADFGFLEDLNGLLKATVEMSPLEVDLAPSDCLDRESKAPDVAAVLHGVCRDKSLLGEVKERSSCAYLRPI